MRDRLDTARASERKPVALRIRLAFGDLSGFIDRYGINISEAGIFIRSRDPRPVGTRLSFELRLRDDEVVFAGKGVVRWIQGLDASGHGTPGMVIEFDELTQNSRDVLARVLELREEKKLPAAVEPALASSWRPLHEFPVPVEVEEEEEPKPPPVMVPVLDPESRKERSTPSLPPQATPLPRLRPDGLMLPESYNARPRTAWMGMPPSVSLPWAGAPGGEEADKEKSTADASAAGDAISAPIADSAGSDGTERRDGVGAAVTNPLPPRRIRRRAIAVGLDIGWSSIRVAIAADGVPRQIPLHDGAAFPALVAVGDGEPVYGAEALEAFEGGKGNLVRGLAHLAGLRHASPAARTWERRVLTPLADTGNGVGVVFGGDVHCARRLLTGLLEEVRSRVESVLHADIERTVLTVPSFVSIARRNALRAAADAAGFQVQRSIDASLASVLGSYGPRGNRQVLAVDVGGGASIAAVVEQSAHELKLIGEESLPSLGGVDLERVVVENVLRQFEKAEGLHVPRDSVVVHRVLGECAEAMAALGTSLEVEMSVPSLVEVGLGRADLHQRLTRARMLQLLAPHFEPIASLAKSALEAKALTASQVDEVLLLGAQTQIGALAAKLSESLGKEAIRRRFAAQAAALGAALVAEPGGESDHHVLVGTVGSSLSLGLAGGRLQKLLDRRAPLPAERHFMVPVPGNARELDLFLFQGEAPTARESEYVGALHLGPLAPSPASDRHVLVKLKLNEQGALECTAMEPLSGADVPVALTSSRTWDEAMGALSRPAA